VSLNSELVNKGFLVILMGVEDVVGRNGMASLLRQAQLSQYINNYPSSTNEYGGHQLRYMSQINRALFDVYGARGARAILQRVGRSRWQNALEENGALASATKVALRFLPKRRQVLFALDVTAKTYGEQLNTTIRVGEEADGFFWEDLSCGNCIDWHSDIPVCYTTGGFVHGLVAWATGDENAKVAETQCRAVGDEVCHHHIALA
jgi:hypothetical protein